MCNHPQPLLHLPRASMTFSSAFMSTSEGNDSESLWKWKKPRMLSRLIIQGASNSWQLEFFCKVYLKTDACRSNTLTWNQGVFFTAIMRMLRDYSRAPNPVKTLIGMLQVSRSKRCLACMYTSNQLMLDQNRGRQPDTLCYQHVKAVMSHSKLLTFVSKTFLRDKALFLCWLLMAYIRISSLKKKLSIITEMLLPDYVKCDSEDEHRVFFCSSILSQCPHQHIQSKSVFPQSKSNLWLRSLPEVTGPKIRLSEICLGHDFFSVSHLKLIIPEIIESLSKLLSGKTQVHL